MLMLSKYNHSGSQKQSEIALEINLHIEVKISNASSDMRVAI
jgi:hypothetical protein